jgi:pyruvate,water dikinase
MGRLIINLESRRAVRESLAGGKGAGLARLRRAGFRVPPGFVITTAVFHGALTAAVRRIAFENKLPDLGNLDAVRDSFLSWDIVPAHRNAILKAYRRLGGPVAVRSSMVGEDSKKASFAGQLDTFLDVSGEEEVLAAVRKCLASAFGSRLWAYVYQKDGTPADRMSLAVVVQSMVKAVVSGVAFSADPVSCERGIIIESVPGLGDALVQGRATPDRHRVNATGELTITLSSGPALLGTDRMRELAAIVQAIAEKFGTPQDVEWAFDGRDFHILQARPITAAASRRVYSNRLVSDMAPGLVKPLLWSTKYKSIVNNVFAPVFEEILGRSGTDYSRLMAKFHSRVYADVTMFGELLARAGLPPNFFESIIRDEKATPVRLSFHPRTFPVLFRSVLYGTKQLRIEPRVRRFFDHQHRLLETFRSFDWASVPPAGLLDHLDRLNELHGQSQWHMIHVSMNMMIRNKLLGRLLRRWSVGVDPGDALKGFGRRGTVRPYDEMTRLAEGARAVGPHLIERMAGDEDLDIRAELSATAEGRRLAGEFDMFMSRYGFLSANGSDFSEVPWDENPRLIWKTVARIALAQPSAPWGEAGSGRREALARVRAGLSPLQRRLFDRLQKSAAALVDWREKVSLLMSEIAYHMRRCALALGSELAARKVLGDAADVFYLYEDELKRVLADPREAGRAWELVNARKAELAADAALDPPETICGDGAAPPERPADNGQPFLRGIGGSTGISTGRARIIRDPALAAERPGETDILIVPFTDVGWTPFLSGVGGLVAESGGQLSHTSIIAREFGIPAVVGVPEATSRIREGQLITVDGTAGRVYLHPAERAAN